MAYCPHGATTLSITIKTPDTQHNSIMESHHVECRSFDCYAECRYGECRYAERRGTAHTLVY